jgi:pyruvate dehydrogenase E2 component (dihydrolipoamide acetyltransferase)
MATNVIMPALGMDQETGLLVRWIKREGEQVMRGEAIMEIETDKVTVEIEANATGILANVSAQEGDEIPVGQVIAQILDAEDADSPPAPDPSVSPSVDAPEGRTLASPLARRLANEQGIDLTAVAGNGPEGAVIASDVRSAPLSAAPIGEFEAPVEQPAGEDLSPEFPGPAEPITVSRAWRVMADRMTASWTTVPHFVLTREVEATALMEMRTRIVPSVEQRAGVRPTYTDLLVKMVAVTLRAHPRLNASWDNGQVRANPQVNVGIATAVEDALVVPVILGADGLGISEVAARRRDLVDRAVAGQLTPSDLTGGTFTLTNLGKFGVDSFTAIINPPQAAILAVGRIAERVVAREGQPAVRPTIILTLSSDHRVVDGARAAQFLDALTALIEEPWGLLA